MRNGSKPCRLRPVGRMAGVRSRSPPGAGRTKRPSSACRMPAISWSCGQQRVGRGQLAAAGSACGSSAGMPARGQRCGRRLAGDQRLDRGALGPLRRARPRPATAAGRRARAALGAWPTTCRPCGISVYSSSSTASVERARSARRRRRPRPARPAARSSAAACAWISSASSARSRLRVGLQAAVALERGLQVDRPRYSPACATGGVR